MPFFVPRRHHLVPSRIRPDHVRRRWVVWTNGGPALPRKSRCFVRSQGGGMRRYAYELQLHHARLVQPIHVSSRTPSLLFTIVDSSLLSSLHSLSTIPPSTFFLTQTRNTNNGSTPLLKDATAPFCAPSSACVPLTTPHNPSPAQRPCITPRCDLPPSSVREG